MKALMMKDDKIFCHRYTQIIPGQHAPRTGRRRGRKERNLGKKTEDKKTTDFSHGFTQIDTEVKVKKEAFSTI